VAPHTFSGSGVLNLDKPSGPTSHDMVARVRRLFGTRRVGHAGTLDPAATGVLVVLLGVATRLAEYVTDLPKRYEAEILFGRRTDTQDSTGMLLSECDTSFLTASAVRAAMEPLRGDILQVPPMVSAVKIGGKRLYELARRGETVERVPRPVTVYELRLEEFLSGSAARGQLSVCCSSGTYVRTLCADLGEALGCGAVMGNLRRTAIGAFRVSEAVSLEQVEQAALEGQQAELLLPTVAAVAHLPSVTVDDAERSRLMHGMTVPASAGPGAETGGLPSEALPSLVRVLDQQGELLAIARWEGKLVPVKVLAEAAGDRAACDEQADRGATWLPEP
jgi:tRNA pseudouridine55 synthase